MPLRIADPPAESVAALRGFTQAPPQGQAEVAGGAPESPPVMLPHKVYTVGLDDLVSGRDVKDARLAGWRYIVEAPGGRRMAAEVPEQGQLAELNEGPFVQETLAKTGDAESLPPVVKGSYELNVLRIPALYVMALWLKDERGENDLIIPMGPTLPQLQPGHAYTLPEILPILTRAAQERLAFDDSPQGEPPRRRG